jgi:hypothetical protein
LVLKLDKEAPDPRFKEQTQSGSCSAKEDLVVYFTNRCPFSEYHVTESLPEAAKKRGLSYKIFKLDSMEKAQSSPTPATIFSLYYKGKFATTDLSVCMDSRMDKILSKF